MFTIHTAERQTTHDLRSHGHHARSLAPPSAFSVSYDNGRTWHPAKAIGGKRLDLRHPAKAGPVSRRVTLTDAAGNTLKQRIHRAYRTVK
ncbi:hypothetical protein ACFTTN_29225 [Streptomyces niveus]|uniref:hypothetical protein n=1 Tax=Streptomyces niveus TaxID=193462 RepID=UPI00362BFC99